MNSLFFRATFVITVIVSLSVTTQAQAQWIYSALGDSITTAYTVPAGSGYVSRYQDYIQTDTGAAITLYNFGQNGWTSPQLLNALRTDSVFQSAVLQSEVVTWNIGINDLMNARSKYKKRKCGGADNQDCLRSMVAAFNNHWDGIVGENVIRRSTTNTIIRTMDIYNPWIKTDQGKNTTPDKNEATVKGNDFQVLKYYLDQMNGHIAGSTITFAIPCALVYATFNGANGDADPVAKGLIGGDGLHPSDAGHLVIADLFRGLAYAPLR